MTNSQPARPSGPNTVDLARKSIISPKVRKFIDLNTDFGQSRDQKFFENTNYGLLRYVSSVNIPCCVHDGDPKVILESIDKALEYNCVIGAHVAYPDPVHYGYEVMDLSQEELAAWLRVQLGAFQALARAKSRDIEQVRPHGALYGKFLTDAETALTVAKTIYEMNKWWILVGPAGPILKEVEEKVGLRIAPEAYLGKRYASQGHLAVEQIHENLPRQAVLDQARQLINDSTVTTADGKTIRLDYKTIHVSPQVDGRIEIAEKISQMLVQPVSLPLAEVGASGWV